MRYIVEISQGSISEHSIPSRSDEVVPSEWVEVYNQKNHLPGNETFRNIVESQETTSHKSSGHWISRRRISFMKSRHGETPVRATAPRDSIRTLEDIVSERSDYSIDLLRQVTDLFSEICEKVCSELFVFPLSWRADAAMTRLRKGVAADG